MHVRPSLSVLATEEPSITADQTDHPRLPPFPTSSPSTPHSTYFDQCYFHYVDNGTPPGFHYMYFGTVLQANSIGGLVAKHPLPVGMALEAQGTPSTNAPAALLIVILSCLLVLPLLTTSTYPVCTRVRGFHVHGGMFVYAVPASNSPPTLLVPWSMYGNVGWQPRMDQFPGKVMTSRSSTSRR